MLKEVRESKGVKKGAAMNVIGVTYQTYDRFEDDPTLMRVWQAIKLAEFLNVDVRDIFYQQ